MIEEFILLKTLPMPPQMQQKAKLAHENVWILILKNAKVTETKLNYRKVAKPLETRESTHFTRIRGVEKAEFTIYEGYPKTVVVHGQVLPNDIEYVGHPTQKPIDFIRMLIEVATEPGDMILDPFAGSGTTLVAAKMTNRKCIGIEIDQYFAEKAYSRCKNVGAIEGYMQGEDNIH